MLLDTAFASPQVFRSSYKRANLKHVRYDFNLSPKSEDKHIYQLASETDRIVISQDLDFLKITKPKMAGVIIIPPYLSNEKIDQLICSSIRGKDPSDFKGKATKI